MVYVQEAMSAEQRARPRAHSKPSPAEFFVVCVQEAMSAEQRARLAELEKERGGKRGVRVHLFFVIILQEAMSA